MKIAYYGKEYLEVDESWLEQNNVPIKRKVHLVKLKFQEPTYEKINKVLEMLPETKRFIVQDNVRIYNYVFKYTLKKYYVENCYDDYRFFSFLKGNNKILINFTKFINSDVKTFLLNHLLEDIIKNVEVIKMNKTDFINNRELLESWSGNVILVE